MVSEETMSAERHFLEENLHQCLPMFCWAPCGFSSNKKIGPSF